MGEEEVWISLVVCTCHMVKNSITSNENGSLIHRADYQRLMVAEARRLGADIRLGCSVVKVGFGPDEPCITLADGEVIIGDVVIGADGTFTSDASLLLLTEQASHQASANKCLAKRSSPRPRATWPIAPPSHAPNWKRSTTPRYPACSPRANPGSGGALIHMQCCILFATAPYST